MDPQLKHATHSSYFEHNMNFLLCHFSDLLSDIYSEKSNEQI